MPGGLTTGTAGAACLLGALAFGVAYGTADKESVATEPVQQLRLGAPAAALDVSVPEPKRLALGRAAGVPELAARPRPARTAAPAPPPPAPDPEPLSEPDPPPPPVFIPPPAPAPAPAPVAPAPEPPLDFDDSG